MEQFSQEIGVIHEIYLLVKKRSMNQPVSFMTREQVIFCEDSIKKKIFKQLLYILSGFAHLPVLL